MGDVILIMDNFHKIKYCKICHETEFETCKLLETPCSCSGTLKFAHRECIQRWCDEKGDTICEICLQKYEPGYTTIPKKPKRIIVRAEVVNIRENLAISRAGHEIQNSEIQAIAGCSSSASCCKTLALICTALLMMRHLFDVLMGGAGNYPFSLVTVLLLRTCGIIVPMYVIIWTITALHNSIRHGKLHETLIRNANNGGGDQEQVHGRDNLF